MSGRTVVSLFSGIGGMDEGLRRAGWKHVLFCESDSYRRDVLRARFPGVPVYKDVADVARPRSDEERNEQGRALEPRRGDLGLLAGGFPCQDVSVAGRRAGLAGERSGLFHEFARIADALRPQWLLVENVPGLLSSNGGRDFGVVLGTLADLGYGVAWRILDSRFFGVPQRRRRVFIVGAVANSDSRAAAERAGEVLAVGSRCDRHFATRGEAREDAAIASLSGLGTGGPDDNDGQGGRLIAKSLMSSKTSGWRGNDTDETFIAHTLRSEGFDASEDGTGRGTPLVAAPLSHGSNLNSNAAGRRREDDENLVVYGLNTNRGGNADVCLEREAVPPITNSHGNPGGVMLGASVRRLMPVECERLQALPDGWTDLGGTPDSRRYAALGDAVTVSVAEWIGRRLIEAAA